MERWEVALRIFLAIVFSWCLGFRVVLASERFSYLPVNDLTPDSGKGDDGALSDNAPGIRFPLESGPAYANSQVFNSGGSCGEHSIYPRCGVVPQGVCQWLSGIPDLVCNSLFVAPSFSYPWRPNFCEMRGRVNIENDTCRNQNVDEHLGQDIRGADATDNVYRLVAVVNGVVRKVVPRPTDPIQSGSSYVDIEGDDGNIYSYVHLDSIDQAIKTGNRVVSGQFIGLMSNIMGTSTNYRQTTVHLHFEIRRKISGVYYVVSPYLALVHAYERLIGQTGVQMYQLGQTVYAADNLNLRVVAGATTSFGTVGAATKGTILEGPQRAVLNDQWYTWWKVQWASGQTGWVVDFLQFPRFSNGERVEVFGSSSAPVSSAAGGSSFTTMPIGSIGTILTDPVATYSGGTHLWRRIHWDSGQEGWTEEYYLKSSLVTSCSATTTILAKRGLLPRALALQCGGSTPTATVTPTRTNTVTPTRTWTLPIGAPSWTPTSTQTRTRTPSATATQTNVPGTPTPTPGLLVFRDDFNRPDANTIGNGWRNANSAMVIQGNRLVGGGSIVRDLPFQFPIRIRARLTGGGCGTEGGATNHFDHQITIMSDPYGFGGYGLYFFRADQSVSTSQILLMSGSTPIDRIYGPVEFQDFVDVDFTVFIDGSVRGVYRTQGFETPFSFGARNIPNSGNGLALRIYWNCPENFLAFDDLVVEAGQPIIVGPSSTPTASFTPTYSPTRSQTSTATPSASRTPTPGSCFQVHSGPGCNDALCQSKVCAADQACCRAGYSWDSSCVAAATYYCRTVVVGATPTPTATRAATPRPTPTATPTSTSIVVIVPTATPTATATPTQGAVVSGNCCTAHAGGGCTIPQCSDAVCKLDAYCCGAYGGSWDASCANMARSIYKAICGC